MLYCAVLCCAVLPQVRGVLNDEEVQMAATSRYLRGVHALVATPDMALALLSLPNSPLSFQVGHKFPSNGFDFGFSYHATPFLPEACNPCSHCSKQLGFQVVYKPSTLNIWS